MEKDAIAEALNAYRGEAKRLAQERNMQFGSWASELAKVKKQIENIVLA
ncbi:hypothetical protein [Rhizobium metallidurans]|uniref:Uncharacterized protein n=1 Tax=Rhizobium metallidurans TaxID=1265931 RepID=A0A7W6CVS5_9HYPH|nr:hypothetical protein [Rhizobium metallidurans]MBB3967306.1 hypothetical protein [Rhizobium metallidurans]